MAGSQSSKATAFRGSEEGSCGLVYANPKLENGKHKLFRRKSLQFCVWDFAITRKFMEIL